MDSLFLVSMRFYGIRRKLSWSDRKLPDIPAEEGKPLFLQGTFNGRIQGFITLNDTVNIWRRISTDDVNAVVQVPKCMRNINIYKVAFDAG